MLKSYRLQNQQIEFPQFDNVVDVLSHMGAIQGQDYPGAKWSLGLRLPDSTDAQVEKAIADKQIVRTWLMRGTLFLVSAKDVHWMLNIFGPRVIAQSQRRYKELELDAEILSRSNDVLVNALADGKEITRRQLYNILEDNGISTAGQRGAYIVRHTSMEGLIVHGIASKNDPVFILFDGISDTANSMTRDDALAELAYRYFNSRGPATLQDFSWWSGLLMADVRAGFEAIRHKLVEEVIDGEGYYRISHLTAKASPESPCVYTLPGFDEYYLGYQNRADVIDPQHELKVCPGKNGMFFPTIVIDGQIRGVWKRQFKKDKVEIGVQPFAPLTKHEQDAFVTAIQRLGRYYEMAVDIKSIEVR